MQQSSYQNPVIESIDDYLFILNKKLTESQTKKMQTALEVIVSLFLIPFELVLFSEENCRSLQYSSQLYQDPEIFLLSPAEIIEKDLMPLGYSSGIIEQTGIGYKTERGFIIAHSLSELADTFTGYDSLLFMVVKDV